jgi:hypothetical protein
MLLRIFLAPLSFLAAMIWTIWAQAAERSALANTRDFQGLVGKIAYSPGKRVPDKAVAVIKIDDGVETPVWTWMPQRQ